MLINKPRLEGNELVIQALGRTWRLDHSQSLESLWENMSLSDLADERIPYWAELWPSSLALAPFLVTRQQEIRQGLCLDLGCGCGFTTLIACSLGAAVAGCDYLPAALACAQANAVANGINAPWLCMDWRAPALTPGSIWRMWAADIVYERRSFEPVLACLDLILGKDGRAWIAEPGREIFRDFLHLARESRWQATPVARQNVHDLYTDNVPITIWEFKAP